MDPKFFRKYADLITEAEQGPDLAKASQTLVSKLKPQEQQALIAMAEKIVGKPASQITPQDAIKFGPQMDAAIKGGGLEEEALNELNMKAAWDTVKSKLIPIGATIGLAAGSVASAIGGDYMSAGTLGGVALLGAGVAAGNIDSMRDEYKLHKERQTATDPTRQKEIDYQIGRLNL